MSGDRVIGWYTGDCRFHSFVIIVGVSHRYRSRGTTALQIASPGVSWSCVSTDMRMGGGWGLYRVDWVRFLLMFSTHGNMAFHQGDISDVAINLNLNIKY